MGEAHLPPLHPCWGQPSAAMLSPTGRRECWSPLHLRFYVLLGFTNGQEVFPLASLGKMHLFRNNYKIAGWPQTFPQQLEVLRTAAQRLTRERRWDPENADLVKESINATLKEFYKIIDHCSSTVSRLWETVTDRRLWRNKSKSNVRSWLGSFIF